MSPSPTDTCRLSLSITEGETDYLYWVTNRRQATLESGPLDGRKATVWFYPGLVDHLLL